MKKLLTSILLIISASASAQTIVTPDSAKYFEGSLTTVCGQITAARNAHGGIIKLEFGKPSPDESFAGIIFAEDTAKFKPAEYYKDKNVCLIGKVQLYKGRAEIILKNPNQLREQ